jgi:hypothetical protein
MTLMRFPVLLSAAFVLGTAGSAPAADTHVVRGQVTKIDRTSKTIVIRPNNGADVIVAVTDASRLEVGRKPATLAQVKEGQRVRVTYDPKAKTLVSLKPTVTTDDDLGREVKQALAAVKDYTFRQKDKYVQVAGSVRDRSHATVILDHRRFLYRLVPRGRFEADGCAFCEQPPAPRRQNPMLHRRVKKSGRLT